MQKSKTAMQLMIEHLQFEKSVLCKQSKFSRYSIIRFAKIRIINKSIEKAVELQSNEEREMIINARENGIYEYCQGDGVDHDEEPLSSEEWYKQTYGNNG